jgi:hypothetical protein
LVAATTSLLPSADDETDFQQFQGMLTEVQLWAIAAVAAVNQPQKAAAMSSAILVFMRIWRFQPNTRINHAISDFIQECGLLADELPLDA